MTARSTLFVVAAIALGSAIADAQPPAPSVPPPPMSNLQVFPKDASRQQVVTAMQGFAQALGVRCEYCHVDEPGVKVDMASDEKPAKKTARAMLLMTRDINARIPEATGKTAEGATRVACVTCHRGVAIPRQLADILGDTAVAKGLPSAIARYKELRNRSYGSMAYDFTEGGLIAAANRPGTTPEDAIVWLQLNIEYFPKSARTYIAMAQVHQRANERDAAVKDLEKALDLDPANTQAKQALQRLKTQPK